MHFQTTSAFLLFAGIGLSSAQSSTATQPSSTGPASTASRTSTGTALVTPTVNLFVPAGGLGTLAYVASIVSACSDRTVYALRCTSGSLAFSTCDAASPPLTVTEGPSSLLYTSTYNTQIASWGSKPVSASVAVSCLLSGTTAAECRATMTGLATGTSTVISTTEVFQGTDYRRYDVAITAGADKTLGAASATCSANDAPGTNMKTVAGMGVAGTIGVIAVLMM